MTAWPLSDWLRRDLRERRLTAEKAAAVAGLSSYAVYAWTSGTATPRAGKLRQLLEQCGIDPAPYADFITIKPLAVTVICPGCGRERAMRRALLKPAGRRKRGRSVLRPLGGDRYERPCQTCERRDLPKIGRKALQKVNAERFSKALDYLGFSPGTPPKALGELATRTVRRVALEMALGSRTEAVKNLAAQKKMAAAVRDRRIEAERKAMLDPAWEEMAEAEPKRVEAEPRAMVEAGKRVLAGNHEKFRAMVKAPQSDRHRRAIARSRVLRGAVSGFGLCLLCGLLVQARRWQLAPYGHSWHHDCLIAWRRYCRTVLGPPSGRDLVPRLNRRGRKPTDNLERNYRWLLSRRSGEDTGQRLARRSKLASSASVTEGIKSFVRRLPGSWDLVFPGFKKYRAGNRDRQEVVPLPDLLRPLIDGGARDPIIERLHRYGMADEKTARLTGANLDRVKQVCARTSQAS